MRLERIFRQMSESFGIDMREDAIVGLNGAVLQRWMNMVMITGRKRSRAGMMVLHLEV